MDDLPRHDPAARVVHKNVGLCEYRPTKHRSLVYRHSKMLRSRVGRHSKMLRSRVGRHSQSPTLADPSPPPNTSRVSLQTHVGVFDHRPTKHHARVGRHSKMIRIPVGRHSQSPTLAVPSPAPNTSHAHCQVSLQIKAVQLHDLVPCGDEITHKLGPVVVLRIQLGQGAQL